MSTAYDKPLPDIHDPVMAPFWVAAREGRLVVQRCTSCSKLRWPPIPICHSCWAEGGEWIDIEPTGRIWSYAVYHRAFHRGFEADVPYVVAMVETDAGPRLVGRIEGPREGVAIGRQVRAVFDAVTPDVTLVAWKLE
jgi:uncharacterized OB-fold protein